MVSHERNSVPASVLVLRGGAAAGGCHPLEAPCQVGRVFLNGCRARPILVSLSFRSHPTVVVVVVGAAERCEAAFRRIHSLVL